MPVFRACPLRRLCSCGLPSTSQGPGTLILTKLKAMKPKTGAAYSRRAVSRTTGIKKGEESVLKKEDVVEETQIEIEEIRGDPSRLQSMTVKELRELTRRVGVSARGTKKDLVLALMTSLHKDETGNNELLSSGQMSPPSVPSKRKHGGSLVEDKIESLEVISEASDKKKRGRRKQQSIESTSIEGDSVTTVVQHKSLVKKEEIHDQGNVAIADEVGHVEPWTILAHKKPQAGWIPYNPRIMRPSALSKDTKALKVLSWNVNGLRALLKMQSFAALQLAKREDFDVLCLQETKMQEKDVEVIKESLLEGYNNSFWTCSVSKLGYSGTAIISRVKPLSVKYGLGISDHDSEGRLVTVEFDDFYLLNAYVPNSGDGLRRLTYRVKEWDPCLGNYMKELEKFKPVILTGDLNCAHEEIDIYNPAGNRRSAGFTIEERESFETNFLSKGFVDTFRKQNPNVVAYTYWGYRHGGRKTNRGWRLDYFLVSESMAERVHDSYILPDISGSDHSPIGLILKL